MAHKYPHTIAVSLRGALHKAKNLPCQDYFCHRRNKNKFVAVISDGAGSAPHSRIGAKTVCQTLCDILSHSNLQNIQSDVKKAIIAAREKLILHSHNKSKSAEELINYAATLVGVFCYKQKGIFFHIGDGAGIAYTHNNYKNMVVSEPENGAFSCETFFYTMTDWDRCLRFTSFDYADYIMLMSDGVTGFVFADDFYNIRNNFFVPIANYLTDEHLKKTAEKALINTLDDTRARRLNADDKTLLWACLK